MKTTLTTFVLLLFAFNISFGQQARFVTSGKIEYEKSVNMYTVIKSNMDERDSFDALAFEAFKKNNPQYRRLKSTLTIGDNKSLYTPVAEDDGERKPWDEFSNQVNTTYTDIANHSVIIHKDVFGEEFLLKDSVRKIKWKITDETRDIAGYPCRRANGIIMDSIYVVAFYTNKIPVFSGPESFTGLPGMILQVSVPHENVTWLATNVTDTTVPATALTPPKKGKPANRKQLYDALKSAMKNWGKYGKQQMKLYML